jgi:MFS family permease
VGRTVVALGLTSMFTDISSEMVTTILPIYLVLHLGFSPLQFGIVDGLYHGVTTLVRLLSGVVADRWTRYKEVALLGYAVSAICKLGLAISGTGAWSVLTGIVVADRVGKGVRTAPRDALISLSTPPEDLALGFGVHRALDSVGAMLGPLVALGILAALPGRFDVVFVWSFSIALIGVGVLLVLVENARPSDAPKVVAHGVPTECGSRYGYGFVGLAVAATALSLTTISDAFLYLLIQRQMNFSTGLFPLLFVGSAAAYFVFAIPAGRLADRVGRRGTLLGGYALLAGAYLLTMAPALDLPGVVACLLLLGGYYAMTDGVLMALVSQACAPERRASAMALVGSLTSGSRFLGSIAFGALWTWYGERTAITVFLLGQAAAVVFAGIILTATRTRYQFDAATD